MNSRHVVDDLSAYMDGECPDPRPIERHLQSCPDCAQHYMELQKLSSHLRVMPCPELDPVFTARVLEKLEPTMASSGWGFRLVPRFATAFVLAASLVVVGIGIAYKSGQVPIEPTGHPLIATEAFLDDEAAIIALGELLEAGIWGEPFEFDDAVEEPEVPPTVDALIDSLVTWTLDEETAAWYEPDDFSSVMEALALEDVGMLEELASNHWDEV